MAQEVPQDILVGNTTYVHAAMVGTTTSGGDWFTAQGKEGQAEYTWRYILDSRTNTVYFSNKRSKEVVWTLPDITVSGGDTEASPAMRSRGVSSPSSCLKASASKELAADNVTQVPQEIVVGRTTYVHAATVGSSDWFTAHGKEGQAEYTWRYILDSRTNTVYFSNKHSKEVVWTLPDITVVREPPKKKIEPTVASPRVIRPHAAPVSPLGGNSSPSSVGSSPRKTSKNNLLAKNMEDDQLQETPTRKTSFASASPSPRTKAEARRKASKDASPASKDLLATKKMKEAQRLAEETAESLRRELAATQQENEQLQKSLEEARSALAVSTRQISSECDAKDYRARVSALVQRYKPDRLSILENLMKKHEGREQMLIEALIRKYGPEPTPAEGGWSPKRIMSPQEAKCVIAVRDKEVRELKTELQLEADRTSDALGEAKAERNELEEENVDLLEELENSEANLSTTKKALATVTGDVRAMRNAWRKTQSTLAKEAPQVLATMDTFGQFSPPVVSVADADCQTDV